VSAELVATLSGRLDGMAAGPGRAEERLIGIDGRLGRVEDRMTDVDRRLFALGRLWLPSLPKRLRLTRHAPSGPPGNATPPLSWPDDQTGRIGGLTLRGVEPDVRPGQVPGLFDPNGVGQTALFRIFTGLLPADAGSDRDSTICAVGLLDECEHRHQRPPWEPPSAKPVGAPGPSAHSARTSRPGPRHG
jgi:hypothetical protein